MDEFAFIRDHLAPWSGAGAEGLADDVARFGDGFVVSTDTCVEGVHFPRLVRGAAASERAVRVAASDLAAKGAEPVGMLCNLSLPRDMEDKWVVALAQGLRDGSEALGLPLLGGDTVRHDGKLSVTVTVIGREARSLKRSGAVPGQGVYLSGPVGDAYLGLHYFQGRPPMPDPTGDDLYLWEEAFLRPRPRFDLREVLQGASASIDVSDGLVADAGHVARASGVGLDIELERVPFSDTCRRWMGGSVERAVELITAGDDYEVLWTADGADAVRIGTVCEGEGVRVLDADGAEVPIAEAGWNHA